MALFPMEIFLDTADYGEIKDRYETGLVAGITTNPTLILISLLVSPKTLTLLAFQQKSMEILLVR